MRRQHPEQLAFFPDLEPPPQRGGVCLAEISDVAAVLRRVRIRELWILRAHALAPDRWRDLVWLSTHADVGLYLVLHGRGATTAQLDRLRRCHLVYPRPPKLHGSAATPWWSRPPYRAGTAAPAALVKRLAQPRRRDPPVPVSARPAPPPAPLSGAELFERFRVAAAALLQDDEVRSFVVLEPQALPAAPGRISPERLAAALQAVARRGRERIS